VTGSGNDPNVRNLLSSLRALLALTTLMTEHGNEDEIVGLAVAAISSLGTSPVSGSRPTVCHAEGAYLDGRWRAVDHRGRGAGDRQKLEAQLLECGPTGGPLGIPEQAWGWAYPLTSPGGASGYLVVGGADEPSDDVQFLLRTLAQQAGVALANARLHARERLTAEELQVANSALRLRIEIHERLTAVVTAGEGQTGIARAVHELTGYPVVIEDRWGTLRAWAGPDRPEVYPREQAGRREPLLRRIQQAGGHPIRDKDRLIVVASPREDVVGVLALVDPDGTAGEKEHVALEHGATVLAMELARLASLAETELRQRRDLVEELLAGHDEEAAFNRAQAIGYDLGRPHRVVVVTGGPHDDEEETLFHAVRRAARDLKAGSLLVARAGEVVLFSDRDASWAQLQTEIDSALHGHCRIGVGGTCERPRDFARSHRDGQLALRMQKAVGGGQGVTQFEDLGVYQVLSELPDIGSVERFVRRWLGPLLDHDAQKGSQLVATLSGYLESGGHYDAAADLLVVHRSTLKYRLQQIRTVTGYDLGDADTSFNLHLAARAWRTLEAMRDP
jgi:sugar diacid utilization regulator